VPRNSIVLQSLPREKLLAEAELAHVGHPHGVEDAIEMIDFMLHDAGMKAADATIDVASLLIDAAVA
jgi:hypothetical protein